MTKCAKTAHSVIFHTLFYYIHFDLLKIYATSRSLYQHKCHTAHTHSWHRYAASHKKQFLDFFLHMPVKCVKHMCEHMQTHKTKNSLVLISFLFHFNIIKVVRICKIKKRTNFLNSIRYYMHYACMHVLFWEWKNVLVDSNFPLPSACKTHICKILKFKWIDDTIEL